MSCITDFSVPPTQKTRLWTSTTTRPTTHPTTHPTTRPTTHPTTYPTTHPTTTGGMFESFAYFNFFFSLP